MKKYTVFVDFVKNIEDWDDLENGILYEKHFDVCAKNVLDAYKLAEKEADKFTEYADYYISGCGELEDYNETL